MRANSHIVFSVGIYSDGPSPGPGLGPSPLIAPFSPDSEPVGERNSYHLVIVPDGIAIVTAVDRTIREPTNTLHE